MAFSPLLFPSCILDQDFGMYITPQDLIIPSNSTYSSNYFRPWKWYMENGSKQSGSSIENQKDRFQISLDVQHFKPNEISVKVIKRDILIEGKHEERIDVHGFVSRQFTRRYVLPNDCEPEDVLCDLSADGILMVVADKRNTKISSQEIMVPITLCESFSKKQEAKSSQTTTDIQKKEEIKNDIEERKSPTKAQLTNLIMKEGHSCLLKPEFMKQSTSETCSTAEKIISESKMETDELFKMTAEKNGQTVTQQSGVKEKIGQATLESEIAKASDNIIKMVIGADEGSKKITSEESVQIAVENLSSKSTVSASSEVSSYSTMSSEKIKSQESSSSYMSSASSSLKATNEKSSELCDTISAALREAAENL